MQSVSHRVGMSHKLSPDRVTCYGKHKVSARDDISTPIFIYFFYLQMYVKYNLNLYYVIC